MILIQNARVLVNFVKFLWLTLNESGKWDGDYHQCCPALAVNAEREKNEERKVERLTFNEEKRKFFNENSFWLQFAFDALICLFSLKFIVSICG